VSAPSFQAPVGTHDVLAPRSALWEGTVASFAEFAFRSGFTLALTPMFEELGVFNRGIGENSDVATKEMYIFQDRGQRTYALRPEGTASIVRAFVQHQPTTPYKAWYVATSAPRLVATVSTTNSASRCSAATTRRSTSR